MATVDKGVVHLLRLLGFERNLRPTSIYTWDISEAASRTTRPGIHPLRGPNAAVATRERKWMAKHPDRGPGTRVKSS